MQAFTIIQKNLKSIFRHCTLKYQGFYLYKLTKKSMIIISNHQSKYLSGIHPVSNPLSILHSIITEYCKALDINIGIAGVTSMSINQLSFLTLVESILQSQVLGLYHFIQALYFQGPILLLPQSLCPYPELTLEHPVVGEERETFAQPILRLPKLLL